MKRIRFQFKSDSYYANQRYFVTPPIPDEEADRLLVLLGNSRQCDERFTSGNYRNVFVAEPISGFAVQAVEAELVISKAEFARLDAEHKAKEATEAKVRADKEATEAKVRADQEHARAAGV